MAAAAGGGGARLLTYAVMTLAAAIVLPWDYKIIPGPMLRNTTATPADEPQSGAAFARHVLRFPCSGLSCQAWLYLPAEHPGAGGALPPVVVAAHGLGGQKDMGLAEYGERFAAAGLASLIFDYRSFGGSDGEPRHWVSPQRHLEDYVSAVAFVRADLSDVVDATKVSLWGTSFAGGHVLALAGSQLRDNVTAVVAQVPFLDGRDTLRRNMEQRGLLFVVRVILAGLHDMLRSFTSHPPAYMALVGGPQGHSFMGLTQQEQDAYFSKHPPQRQGGWRNMVRCRLALDGSRYRPIVHVASIKAPVLYVAAVRDSLCPLDGVRAAARATPGAELVEVDAHHFEVYSGPLLEQLAAQQAAFLRRASGLPPLDSGEPGGGGSEDASGEAAAEAAAEAASSEAAAAEAELLAALSTEGDSD